MLRDGSTINVAYINIACMMVEKSQETSTIQVMKTQLAVAESMLEQEKLKTQVSQLETQVSKLETQSCKVELDNIKEKVATTKLADASIRSSQPQNTPARAQDVHNSATDSKDVDQSSDVDPESRLEKPLAPDHDHDASEQGRPVGGAPHSTHEQVSELTEESHTMNSTPNTDLTIDEQKEFANGTTSQWRE